MDVMIRKKAYPCLNIVFSEVQNVEQTQELKLPDGFPDVGRILGTWGQAIERSKEWHNDRAVCAGGMMIWVLYMPEDGSELRSLNTWCPFQMKWDVPENAQDGSFSVSMRMRFADARSVSPRKIMIRCGAAALGEGIRADVIETSQMEDPTETVQFLRKSADFRVPKESGEKTFMIDETLDIPDLSGELDKLLYYTARPEVTDQKVIANKIAFRGNVNLHVLYSDKEGRMAAVDYLLPFSQFAELEDSFGSEAQVTVQMAVTNLEADIAENSIQARCGLLGQYLVDDKLTMEIVEDAYSPEYNLEIEQHTLSVPAFRGKYNQLMHSGNQVPCSASQILDSCIQPDFPNVYRDGEKDIMEMSGNVTILYLDAEGNVCGASSRWEGKQEYTAEDTVKRLILPCANPELHAASSNGNLHYETDIALEVREYGGQGIPSVASLKVKDQKEPDAQRPSLILRRVGCDTLWEVAKSCGSSVEMIRKVNGIEDQPKAGQILLIPVL